MPVLSVVKSATFFVLESRALGANPFKSHGYSYFNIMEHRET